MTLHHQRPFKRKKACSKTRYRDGAQAKRALANIRAQRGRAVVPKRAYRCDSCGGWHLTSMPLPGDP